MLIIAIVHPCRVAVESLACTLRYFPPRISGYTQLTNPDTFLGGHEELRRRYILSFIILVAAYTFAFVIPNLEEFLAFVGATGGVVMCFVLPTIFYVHLADFESARNSMGIALWISIFGVVIGIAQILALFVSAKS